MWPILTNEWSISRNYTQQCMILGLLGKFVKQVKMEMISHPVGLFCVENGPITRPTIQVHMKIFSGQFGCIKRFMGAYFGSKMGHLMSIYPKEWQITRKTTDKWMVLDLREKLFRHERGKYLQTNYGSKMSHL